MQDNNKSQVDTNNAQPYISTVQKEIDKVVSIVGCQSRLAEAIGVSDNAVSKWVAQGFVPPGRVLSVYQLVKGKLTPSGEQVDLVSLLMESENKQNK